MRFSCAAVGKLLARQMSTPSRSGLKTASRAEWMLTCPAVRRNITKRRHNSPVLDVVGTHLDRHGAWLSIRLGSLSSQARQKAGIGSWLLGTTLMVEVPVDNVPLRAGSMNGGNEWQLMLQSLRKNPSGEGPRFSRAAQSQHQAGGRLGGAGVEIPQVPVPRA
jgi:hypothetical protein